MIFFTSVMNVLPIIVAQRENISASTCFKEEKSITIAIDACSGHTYLLRVSISSLAYLLPVPPSQWPKALLPPYHQDEPDGLFFLFLLFPPIFLQSRISPWSEKLVQKYLTVASFSGSTWRFFPTCRIKMRAGPHLASSNVSSAPFSFCWFNPTSVDLCIIPAHNDIH